MKALYFDNEKLNYKDDYEKPIPKDDESLIRITYAGICNTDKEIMKGYKPDFKGILGHEFVGVVEESNDKSLIGKRVVGEINRGCGHCIYCKTNREKHCLTREVLGMENHDGVFAEYITWSTRLLHIIPDNLKDEEALFTEPLAAAVEILDQVHIKPSTNIAVIGDGRLSFMISQVIALTGGDLTVIGRHENKLEPFKAFAKTTKDTNDSYEVVIDATGSPSGFETAKKIVRKQGLIIVKSTYAENINIDLSYFVVNEITIKGSRCGPFEPALSLLEKKYVQFPKIEFYELFDFEEAFSSKSFKVGFKI